MLTITIVRHGESTDNLLTRWAGWKDAPLSVHGMNQAKALGRSFKDTHVDAIYSSDLLRALWTAQQVEQNIPEPKAPLTVSQLLREQHFGKAEGHDWGEKSGFVRAPGRHFKFERGECLEDVRNRANEAIATFIEPHIAAREGKPPNSFHVVVVAHGIFNSEFVGALMARQANHTQMEWRYRGMTNTGWTRMELGYVDEKPASSTQPVDTTLRPANPNATLRKVTLKITATDVTSHLDGVHRQNGLENQAFDRRQADIRKFFSGGGGAGDAPKSSE